MFKNSFKLVKKIFFPLLACIALPTSIQANVDPKVAEICMKAADFKGCVESMSGMKKNNSSPKSEYENALVLLESGDSAGAINAINKGIAYIPIELKKTWRRKHYLMNESQMAFIWMVNFLN